MQHIILINMRLGTNIPCDYFKSITLKYVNPPLAMTGLKLIIILIFCLLLCYNVPLSKVYFH
jgi:hypothetical protein